MNTSVNKGVYSIWDLERFFAGSIWLIFHLHSPTRDHFLSRQFPHYSMESWHCQCQGIIMIRWWLKDDTAQPIHLHKKIYLRTWQIFYMDSGGVLVQASKFRSQSNLHVKDTGTPLKYSYFLIYFSYFLWEMVFKGVIKYFMLLA